MAKNVLIVDGPATQRALRVRRGHRDHLGILGDEDAGDVVPGPQPLAIPSFDLILADLEVVDRNRLIPVRAVRGKLANRRCRP